MKYFVKTFGCQMNVHDSEKIAGILSGADINKAHGTSDADIIVFNTCSIREKAEQKFYSELGRLKKIKKARPGLKIAVAGCIAQQKGKALLKRFPYVDFVFGPDNIDKLERWVDQKTENRIQNTENRTQKTEYRAQTVALMENPGYHAKTLPVRREGNVRAWVSIMYGCNNFCAYCVVPYTRGRERSRPSEDISREIEALSDDGFKEITLLGQNVNSYGKTMDEDIDFPGLLEKIHDINGIQRIRFVTSHPKDLSERLIRCMAELPKVCEHIHLPLQSGSDRILRLMNRKYTFFDYMKKVELLRKLIPGVAITTDIITGFPGENEEDFDLTVRALKEIEYDGLFAFKYSKRPQTAALELPDHVDEDIKSDRLSRILHLQEGITYRKNKKLEGRTLEILVEGESETDNEKMTGRTRTNKIVNYYGKPGDRGCLVNIKIIEAKQHSLFGKKIK